MDWPKFNTDRIGQLIMCEGGSCGNKEKNATKVPLKKFKKRLKEKGMSKYFKINGSSCLGVCKPHNVSVVLAKDTQIWLGMLHTEKEYDDLFNWITDSIVAKEMLPLPMSLEKNRFNRF